MGRSKNSGAYVRRELCEVAGGCRIILKRGNLDILELVVRKEW